MTTRKQQLLNIVKDLMDDGKKLQNDNDFDNWIKEAYIALKTDFPDEKALTKEFKAYKDSDINLDTDYNKTWFAESDRDSLIKQLEKLVIRIQETNPKKRPEEKTKTEKSIDLLEHLISDLESLKDSEQFNRWRDRATDFLLPLTGKSQTYIDIYKMRAGMGGDDEWKAAQLERYKKTCTSLLRELIRIWEVVGVEDTASSNSAPATVINLTQNQSNNQTQSNHQETNINLEINNILEHFKDSLTGGEIKAIKEVHASDDEPVEKKKKILEILGDKALDLGVALAATPEVWHWIMDRFK